MSSKTFLRAYEYSNTRIEPRALFLHLCSLPHIDKRKMTPPPIPGRLSRIVIVATVAATTACLDRPIPTQVTSRLTGFSIEASFQRQSAPDAHTVEFAVTYERTPAGSKPLTTTRLNLALGDQQASLTIDLAACLGDRLHAGGAGACMLDVTTSLLDTAGTVIDGRTIGPIVAAPGGAVTADAGALCVLGRATQGGTSPCDDVTLTLTIEPATQTGTHSVNPTDATYGDVRCVITAHAVATGRGSGVIQEINSWWMSNGVPWGDGSPQVDRTALTGRVFTGGDHIDRTTSVTGSFSLGGHPDYPSFQFRQAYIYTNKKTGETKTTSQTITCL